MSPEHTLKPSLSAFIATCTPLAVIDELEQDFQARVDDIAQRLASFSVAENTIDALIQFLRADEAFFGVILALANISQEKFLRLLTAERFAQGDFGVEWTITTLQRKLKTDGVFAQHIAQLLIEGRNNPTLKTTIAPFHLNSLALPTNWLDIITDEHLIKNVIRRKLSGAYTDSKGDAIETLIRHQLDKMGVKYGITYEKGRVDILGIGKEIDHAIPSINEPYVMVMTSYLETTSSGQTVRANEQDQIYAKILEERRRSKTKRVLVNFVDGAGWLARRSDLRKLYEACDYIVNLKTLDLLQDIIKRHVPSKFFRES
jgi:hypothetical protein